MTVAKWWGVDPDAVETWSIVDFMNRQEYMQLTSAITAPPGPNGLTPAQKPWTPDE
ncbi:MAG: hypothetical protein GY832_08415 [Chloroflexi bacterium]|nr:hypothetical protein [Chloroflexota bacterium]